MMKQKHEKIGRNAPCPCGSGLKYKKCCQAGLPADAQAVEKLYAKKYRIRLKRPQDVEGIRAAGRTINRRRRPETCSFG